MARGLLSGLIWGSIVAVIGAVVVSLSVPLPIPPQAATDDPSVEVPDDTPVSGATQTETNSTPAAPTPAPQPEAPSQPVRDDTSSVRTTETQPTSAPEISAIAPATEPAPETDEVEVAATAETPVTSSGNPASPTVPDAADAPQIESSSAPAPSIAVESADGLGDGGVESAGPEVSTSGESTPQVAAVPSAPSEPGADTAAAITTQPASAQSPEIAGTEAEVAPRIAALPRIESGDGDTDPVPTTEEGTGEQSGSAAAPTQTEAPRIGQRVVPLTERSNTEPEPSEAAQTAPAAPLVTQQRPIDVFAEPFDNPENKPLMGIVLIDDVDSIGAEALDTFPYPISFAISPQDPNAVEKMERHRAAGFEVLTLVDLPSEASAQDAETALAVWLDLVSQSVGVLEGTGTGIQGNRGLSDQVTAILRDRGYGMITQNSGLNTVQKLAVSQGVPAAYVFRDFDGAGQTPTVMRRFLDQAAFRASQEGAVVMLGRVQPDTISALLLWGLQDRANRVALVPASAVMKSTLASE